MLHKFITNNNEPVKLLVIVNNEPLFEVYATLPLSCVSNFMSLTADPLKCILEEPGTIRMSLAIFFFQNYYIVINKYLIFK